jgi:hypothetical protein
MFDVHVELADAEYSDMDNTFLRAAGFFDTAGMGWFMENMLGPYLKKIHENRFRNNGDSASGKWAPLSQYSINRRRAGVQSGEYKVGLRNNQINRRTYELYDWVVTDSWKVAPSGSGAALVYPGSLPGDALLTEKLFTAQHGKAKPLTVARPVLGIGPRQGARMVTMMAAGLETWITSGRTSRPIVPEPPR